MFYVCVVTHYPETLTTFAIATARCAERCIRSDRVSHAAATNRRREPRRAPRRGAAHSDQDEPIAPVSDVLDAITFLSPAQYWSTFATCALVFVLLALRHQQQPDYCDGAAEQPQSRAKAHARRKWTSKRE